MRSLKIRVVAVIIGALLTIIVGSQVYNVLKLQRQSAHWSVQEAFAQIPAHPALARTVLRRHHSPEADVALAVDLFYFLPNPEKQTSKINTLLHQAHALDPKWFHFADFTGDEKSLLELIHTTNEQIAIPCRLVRKIPTLAELTTSIYSDSADNYLPQISCADPRYNLPPSVSHYFQSLGAADGAENYCGTSKYGVFAEQRSSFVFVQYAPTLLSKQLDGSLPDPSARPLRNWSYLSLWNYKTYQSIDRKFIAARKDLKRYYRNVFGMPGLKAALAAQRAVWVLDDAYMWAYDSRASGTASNELASAIMDRHPVGKIAALLKTQPAPAPDLLLAVEYPEALNLLLAQRPDVEATNVFGKTALMEAAMYNQLQSVQLLLAAGAKVNAASLPPDKIPDNEPYNDPLYGEVCGGDYHITHGSRTALMYAAANAGLPVIQTLLKAGADKNAKDSKGADALDYLEGKGPVPRNPVLAAKDFSIAMNLLKP